MAAPSPAETWNFSRWTTIYETRALRCQGLFYQLKNLLCTGTGSWTLLKSCGKNGTGSLVAGDADYLLTRDDVVYHATNPHSWIVVKQTGIATNFQILFDYNDTDGTNMTVWCSFSAGFTGGSTSARPTATDEFQVGVPNFNWASSTQYSHDIWVWKTTSGKSTRICFNWSGVVVTWFVFEQLKNTPDWWTEKAIAGTVYPNATFSYTHVQDAANIKACFSDGVVNNFPCYIASNGWTASDAAASVAMGVPDTLGTCGCFPAIVNTGSYYGPKSMIGEMRDLWFVSDDIQKYSFVPGDGSRSFFVFAIGMIQPHGGIVINPAGG